MCTCVRVRGGWFVTKVTVTKDGYYNSVCLSGGCGGGGGGVHVLVLCVGGSVCIQNCCIGGRK